MSDLVGAPAEGAPRTHRSRIPEVPMARAIDDIALSAGACDATEWTDRVIYLPLR